MILTTDVGSLPYNGNLGTFLKDREEFLRGSAGESSDRFEAEALRAFKDKINSIDVPAYPQLAPMDETFLRLIEGAEKVEGGYVASSRLDLVNVANPIPELEVIRRNSKLLHEIRGNPLRIKVCLMGPYTLSWSFINRDSVDLLQLGSAISKLAESALFDDGHVKVDIVVVDEPLLGVVDDAGLDYGGGRRETLLKSWAEIFHRIRKKGAKTSMHLHSTSNGIFWDAPCLDIVESHVDDHLYTSGSTRKMLEEKDMFLKASLCKTNPDVLIAASLGALALSKRGNAEELGKVWAGIRRRSINPASFIEPKDLMRLRLMKTVEVVGEERVVLAGPECGFGGFFNYASALDCLRVVKEVVADFNRHQPRGV